MMHDEEPIDPEDSEVVDAEFFPGEEPAAHDAPMAYREGDAILADWDEKAGDLQHDTSPSEAGARRLELEVAIGTRDAMENLYEIGDRIARALEALVEKADG